MAAEFLADCAGFGVLSGEESSSSNDDEEIDRDLADLITLSRRGRKRDTAMAFSPVKEDDRKKSRDHFDNGDDDNQRMFIHTHTHTHTHTHSVMFMCTHMRVQKLKTVRVDKIRFCIKI